MLKHVIVTFFLLLVITGCTLSFQNISTHGTATDLIDETQSIDADVTTDIKPPIL